MRRSALDHAASFILEQLAVRQQEPRSGDSARKGPLVVGLQGPQGSGKSYLASKLPGRLVELAQQADPPFPAPRAVAVSLDDFYLSWTDLKHVAENAPTNPLLSGRGQAGTHDLYLGRDVLEQLKNPTPGSEVLIPVFDKSLHDGEGDRLDMSEWVRVEHADQVDVVLFEGWMNGFLPRSHFAPREDLLEVYRAAEQDPKGQRTNLGIDYDRPFILDYSLENLDRIQRELSQYERLWKFIDVFVQLKPERLSYVWQWRLEQEHNMKAKNGGVGMTDAQVLDFVARYMPGYELWLPNITKGRNSWTMRGLSIEMNEAREAVSYSMF